MTHERISANDELAAMVASRQQADNRAADTANLQITPCLLMKMGEFWCALRAESVREVVAVDTVTPLPVQALHVLGVMLVHGRIVPVIDLARLTSKPEMVLAAPPGRRLIVISKNDIEIGLVADDAKGVIDLPAVTTQTDQPTRDDFVLEQIEWQDGLVCFLDAERLLDAALGTE